VPLPELAVLLFVAQLGQIQQMVSKEICQIESGAMSNGPKHGQSEVANRGGRLKPMKEALPN
jgi:hypothetical protein